jgi:hypothetical protein
LGRIEIDGRPVAFSNPKEAMVDKLMIVNERSAAEW